MYQITGYKRTSSDRIPLTEPAIQPEVGRGRGSNIFWKENQASVSTTIAPPTRVASTKGGGILKEILTNLIFFGNNYCE